MYATEDEDTTKIVLPKVRAFAIPPPPPPTAAMPPPVPPPPHAVATRLAAIEHRLGTMEKRFWVLVAIVAVAQRIEPAHLLRLLGAP